MTENGLEAVFQQSRPSLLRFFLSRGCGADAEDMLQELWIKASGVTTGPIAEPVGYLYRMADNLILDKRRSEQRRARRENQWVDMVGGASVGVSDQPSAERILLARDQLQVFERALDYLGERTAQIFRSFRIDGVGQREIAQQLGISLSAVEKHLQKAYRALLEIQASIDADYGLARRRTSKRANDVTE